jgi:hypothetical protein
MQWITVATPPFGWIEQFDKVCAQLGERPAGLQARYLGSGDGKLRLVPLWESKGVRRPALRREAGPDARQGARPGIHRDRRRSQLRLGAGRLAHAGAHLPASRLRPDRLLSGVPEAMGRVVGAKRVAAGFVAAGGAKAAADAFEANLAQPRSRPRSAA